ncbi:dynein heavy chain 8, axonemal [Anopheles sinensis]|uniref:Dynein heavy chain 8, axonemal n=1 Tax=Anopheles sinensis TaxID=74873 RepID=A0A084VVV0_ANOSI|nr:dynein heavy chain 8, axonemal [Anopheles sinensis]
MLSARGEESTGAGGFLEATDEPEEDLLGMNRNRLTPRSATSSLNITLSSVSRRTGLEDRPPHGFPLVQRRRSARIVSFLQKHTPHSRDRPVAQSRTPGDNGENTGERLDV